MDEVITLSSDIFQNLYEENASVAGFELDETVRLQDLLYGILLPSGAECCLAFADRIAGSEETFVELMNRKSFPQEFRLRLPLHHPASQTWYCKM